MPKMPLLRPAAALTALLAFAACTGLGDLQTPQLEVLGVQMLSTDMFAQRFVVRMHVQNPNDIELPVKGIDYTLLLMGDLFAEGKTNEHENDKQLTRIHSVGRSIRASSESRSAFWMLDVV